MELLIKDENGKLIQIEQIGELNAGDVVIRLSTLLSDGAIKYYEKELQKRFDRKVIVLDARVSEIMVVPPKNDL